MQWKTKDKLKDMLRDLDDGLPVGPDNYHVSDAVLVWFTYGLKGRDQATVDNYRCLSDIHIMPLLGKRKLRELSADDVDEWLADRAKVLSTRSLRLVLSVVRRAITFAQAQSVSLCARLERVSIRSEDADGWSVALLSATFDRGSGVARPG